VKVRIGTRGSALALAQSRSVARTLAALGVEPELVVISTLGDRSQQAPFKEVGAAGVFVRELETALTDHRVDLAVHSFKDLPSESPHTLAVAAVPERRDPSDRLLTREELVVTGDGDLESPEVLRLLPRGARVGTASARRRALLLDLRPDLEVVNLRGNVPTRLRKLCEGDYDAIVLATAGLERLAESSDDAEEIAELRKPLVELPLDPTQFVPAPTQGAVACQIRRDDVEARKLLEKIDCREHHPTIEAERHLLARIEGNCDLPFGAWCRDASTAIDPGSERGPGGQNSKEKWEMFAALGVATGLVRAHATGDDAMLIADRVYDLLRSDGEPS
jgi:hydroxymethylbilane synthase